MPPIDEVKIAQYVTSFKVPFPCTYKGLTGGKTKVAPLKASGYICS